MKKAIRMLGALVIFATGYLVGTQGETPLASAAQAAPDERVFELRTYTTHPGKLDDLEKRFRDHTTYLFAKHGMKNIAYWVPTDTPQSRNTLVYVIAHSSRAAAVTSWNGFRTDSVWIRAAAASQVEGPINAKVESVFMKATDFSPIQ